MHIDHPNAWPELRKRIHPDPSSAELVPGMLGKAFLNVCRISIRKVYFVLQQSEGGSFWLSMFPNYSTLTCV